MDIQPRSKAQEALALVQCIDIRAADDLKIAQCKKIAEESLPIDPFSSHLILGIIASFQWNEAGIERHFMEAYNCTHHVDVLFNHSLALRNIQKMADAASIAERASDAAPADLGLLRSALSITTAAGRFEKALSLSRAYALRASHEPDVLGSTLMTAIALLKANKVPLSAVTQAHDIAYSLLHEFNVPSVAHSLDTDPSDQTVASIILLDADVDSVLELDSLLTERLFDEMEELYLADFWIGFERQEKGNTDGN